MHIRLDVLGELDGVAGFAGEGEDGGRVEGAGFVVGGFEDGGAARGGFGGGEECEVAAREGDEDLPVVDCQWEVGLGIGLAIRGMLCGTTRVEAYILTVVAARGCRGKTDVMSREGEAIDVNRLETLMWLSRRKGALNTAAVKSQGEGVPNNFFKKISHFSMKFTCTASILRREFERLQSCSRIIPSTCNLKCRLSSPYRRLSARENVRKRRPRDH